MCWALPLLWSADQRLSATTHPSGLHRLEGSNVPDRSGTMLCPPGVTRHHPRSDSSTPAPEPGWSLAVPVPGFRVMKGENEKDMGAIALRPGLVGPPGCGGGDDQMPALSPRCAPCSAFPRAGVMRRHPGEGHPEGMWVSLIMSGATWRSHQMPPESVAHDQRRMIEQGCDACDLLACLICFPLA